MDDEVSGWKWGATKGEVRGEGGWVGGLAYQGIELVQKDYARRLFLCPGEEGPNPRRSPRESGWVGGWVDEGDGEEGGWVVFFFCLSQWVCGISGWSTLSS